MFTSALKFSPMLNGQVPSLELAIREELTSVARMIETVEDVPHAVDQLVRELNGKYNIFHHHLHAPEAVRQVVRDLTAAVQQAILEGLVLEDLVDEMTRVLSQSELEFFEPVANHPIGWVTVEHVAGYTRRTAEEILKFCQEGRLVHRVVHGTTWVKASSLFSREHWDHLHGKLKPNKPRH